MEQVEWLCFQGSSVSARLLRKVGLFRTSVLADLGASKKFGPMEPNYGDLNYVDFESFQILAVVGLDILGTVRLTPPGLESVSLSILGLKPYLELLETFDGDVNLTYEVNRLMVDKRYRSLALGQKLIFAAVALVESFRNRSEVSIICSAGNCMNQSGFLQKNTGFNRISGQKNCYSSLFNDEISFMIYEQPPYTIGQEWIEFFKQKFRSPENSKRLAHFEAALMAQHETRDGESFQNLVAPEAR